MHFIGFLRDRNAGVAPLFALGLVPLMGSAGAAVDYSRANSARAAMQGALDSAALAMARQSLSNSAVTEQAKVFFSANFNRVEVDNIQVSATVTPTAGGNLLTANASGTVTTYIMGVMGFAKIDISTKSAVAASADGLGCVLSLDTGASAALAAKGTSSIDLKNCSIYDNSANPTALTATGSAKVSALSIGVVGGVSNNGNIVTTEGIRTGIGPVADPYATAAFPTPGACTKNNYKANNKDPETLSPGVFCGGLSIMAGATVTLNPGIYYIDGGGLSVNGGATLQGAGVTLVFTAKNKSDWPTASINGNATVNLTPPNSGPTAGIVMFGDRNMPVGNQFKLNGGATQYIGGVIYFPKGAIDFAGGGIATSTNCTKIIGNTIQFTGNSSLAINCAGYVKNFSPWSVRLVL
jgi:Flp pilus assembly protein TadG